MFCTKYSQHIFFVAVKGKDVYKTSNFILQKQLQLIKNKSKLNKFKKTDKHK
jgi:hypothetical protein